MGGRLKLQRKKGRGDTDCFLIEFTVLKYPGINKNRVPMEAEPGRMFGPSKNN